MSNRNHKAAKVIEQEGEIDEDQEEQDSHQVKGNNQHSGNKNTTSSASSSDHNLEKSSNKSQVAYKEKVFDDIIGLKTHFEEYKSKELNEITNKISNLKIAQEENQNSMKQVRNNLTEEEKIKQIRLTFSQAPLYIFKLKGLKNRMQKIEDKLANAKNKLISQSTVQTKK